MRGGGEGIHVASSYYQWGTISGHAHQSSGKIPARRIMMTRRDAALLASRALALYLIAWALSDLTHLPQSVVSLRHHASVLFTNDYWAYYDTIGFCFLLLRITALFLAAAWLYRCGPGVEAYFLATADVAPPNN